VRGHPTPAPNAERRLALIQLAVGGPAFVLVLFGMVLGYRLAGLPVGDGRFWWVLGPVLGAFALYLGHAILRLRRATGGRSVPPPTTEE
jgi:hypothetical protein